MSKKGWAPGWEKVRGKYQKRAEEAVRETAALEDFAYRGDLPIGETWAFTVTRHRDSGTLSVSNYETIKEDMEKRFPDDVEEVHAGHWAVGWVDHLAVRMLDDDGKVTRAAKAILDWHDNLESYPVADEEDFSRREHEETLENIEFELYGFVDRATAEEVFWWLFNNNPSAVEPREGGAYPSREEIDEALRDLELGAYALNRLIEADPDEARLYAVGERVLTPENIEWRIPDEENEEGLFELLVHPKDEARAKEAYKRAWREAWVKK